MKNKKTVQVRVLARTLRELRLRARMTQQEAGERLRFTNRKMSRLETFQVPDFHELQAMLDLYVVPVTDWKHYVAMWERARERGWWRTFGLEDRGYVPLEAEASLVRCFDLGFVPGLLQSPDYARVVEERNKPTEQQIALDSQIREKRYQRLTSEPALDFHSVINYTALEVRWPCMAEQLAHLVMLAQLENVTLQVLPREAGAHAGLFGSFSLLDFPGPDDPTIAYVEHIAGAVQMEKEDEIRACKMAFGELASAALSHEESVALIDRMASEF